MVMATRGSSRSKPPVVPNSKTRSDRGVQEFYNSLSDKLDALEQSVQPKWLTLEWVSLAVDFMRSTFADMMILFEEVRALMPDVKVGDEFWIEEYMIESMKLLDVCNVLKPAVSRFEHFMMCVQLVVPAIQRCTGEEYANDQTLTAALQSCDSELNELVHQPLTIETQLRTSPESDLRTSTNTLLRHATFSMGEKFTDSVPQATTIRRNWIPKSGRGTVALTLVMRATRKTTDFVASVLIWALKRDPSSHPASTAWQQNLEVFRGDESLWSPSFRRLQERLRKELFEILREERGAAGGGNKKNQKQKQRRFVFEELKLVEERTADVVEQLAARDDTTIAAPAPPLEMLVNSVQGLSSLLDTIQIRLEKVSSQVNQLFDELVQARKKLLDAAQRPGIIHRAHTF